MPGGCRAGLQREEGNIVQPVESTRAGRLSTIWVQ